MIKFFHRIPSSLAGKLLILLGLLILIGSTTFWYISVSTDKKQLMDNSAAFIATLSEVTKRGIRYDMLTFHREAIQKTIESVGTHESIRRVRIFNSEGTVFYSSDTSEIGQNVDRNSPSCIGCHTDPLLPQDTLKEQKRMTIYKGKEGYRILSYVEPIYNEPDCYTSKCHAHSAEQKVLGILETDFSLSPIDMRIKRQMIDTSLYIFAFVAASIALLYFILWRIVLKPISGLSKGMKQVSSGDLSQKVSEQSSDEIGSLARTFNEMTDELSVARLKMEKWTQSLEEEVQKKTDEIKKTQGKLVQAEKLAALGRLTADIAHEIRNPLTALGGFGRRLQKMVTDSRERKYSDIVVSEVDRLEHILRDVLTFSRDARFHFDSHPVTDTVEASVSTFAEMCSDQSIKVEVDVATDLPVLIDNDQVRQAVNNLISNAIDAMPGGGTLSVTIAKEELNYITYVAIHISDTGPGIDENELPLIFEPFHSTKETGHGTGLGLSISRKIIEEHGGFIKAKNRPDGGVTVSLYFPYQSEDESAKVSCWEFMKCGRDVDSEMKCPAYPDFGRVCWVVAGTFCEGKIQGTFAQKGNDCRKCDFFQEMVNEEI